MSETKIIPKHSMKSTWRTQERRQWGLAHWFFDVLGVLPTSLDRHVPVHQKSEKTPYLSDWQLHRWAMFHTAIPLIVHQLYAQYAGTNLSKPQAALFYGSAMLLTSIRELHVLREMGHRHGFLDGDTHERDGVPDGGVWKVIVSLLSTVSFRTLLFVLLAYRTAETPADVNWPWLPFEVGLYAIVLDFWFYWYHRLMHEMPGLWRFHRTHHLTKHPNPLLTLYADAVQEVLDIVGMPLLTYSSMKLAGMPMGFYELWISGAYVVFTELMGHSGLRVCGSTPNMFNSILRLVGAELTIEDHDLHHRKGWRVSGNYGKQTFLWDRIFGTCKDRMETRPANVDYANRITMPIFITKTTAA
ncbi:Fatty acid hydroxylase [Metarhizium album ARSEF 1941]|uniref:Fatty acid hydroxylase n=1 Tax=Metarhizium album (strain ARSEF 1941) TaxID=1081103 RepID=A0A0B2X0Q7_METAS|nr:Fatty acid hydroxylase [Metarhizium album ARSEF 1941]KHN98660.1 Fatty acid hydroxylase [Metarhizium album ARSEF 1941]